MACRIHCVKILHDLREIFEHGGNLRSRSGYCDLEGFQVDLSAHIFWGRLMCFLTGKMFENILGKTHYWHVAWKFNVGWNFVLGQNSMPSRLGVLLGTPGTSKTSISDVRCTKLTKSSKLTTLEKSRGKLGNGRPNIFGDFRRAILWGACGGDPGSIGALGSA